MLPGDYRQARTYLKQAAALFRKLNEKVGVFSSFSSLGEFDLRQELVDRQGRHHLVFGKIGP